MERTFNKWIGAALVTAMFCIIGLVTAGTALSAGGQQSRCSDNGDGTVTDRNTGLMWQKATAGPMNWYDARSYASGLSLGGHSGWRLPTVDELQALFYSPCKDTLDVIMDFYWSSSPFPNKSNYAWVVSFRNGGAGYGGYDSFKLRVRCVRNSN